MLVMASLRTRTRKDGSAYHAVLYRFAGKQTSTSFHDYPSATKFRDLVSTLGPAKALQAIGVDPALVTITVEQWLAHYIEHRTLERSTRAEYRSYLKNDIALSIGSIPLTALTSDDVARWVQAMSAKSASGRGGRNKFVLLSSALNTAVKAGHISTNPAVGQRLPRSEKLDMVCLTHAEFAKLLAEIKEPWRPLVEFLVASGARWGEATALRPADVDQDAGTVRISRAWKRTYQKGGYELGPPKTRKSVRTINVPQTVLAKLDYSGEFLFTNRLGRQVRPNDFRDRVWRPAVAAAGLNPAPRIHDLRHTCASWMIQSGVPLPVIQAHLGHENITTTVDVYGHLDRSHMQAAADVMAQALNG